MAVADAIPSITPDGVHIWALPAGPLRPVLGLPAITGVPPTLPAGYIEDFAAELKVKSKDGRSVVRLPGGAEVIGDLDRGRMKIVAVYFSEALDMLIRAFGAGKVQSTKAFTLVVYQKHEDFIRKAASMGAPNAQSLYDPRGQTIEMPWIGAFDEQWLGRILFHEATHAWMDICFGTRSPLWAAEGISEYFSNFSFRGITEPGPVFESVIAYLPDEPTPTKEFMAYDRSHFYGPAFQALYAQAWSLVAFLMETDPDAVWALLNRRTVVVDDGAYFYFYRQLKELRRG